MYPYFLFMFLTIIAKLISKYIGQIMAIILIINIITIKTISAQKDTNQYSKE